MTNFTKTISDSLVIFGGRPTDTWNSYNWNAFLWGYGTKAFTKIVTHSLPTDTITPSEAISNKAVTILRNSDALTPSAAIPVHIVTAFRTGDAITPSESIAKSIGILRNSDSLSPTEAITAHSIAKLISVDALVDSDILNNIGYTKFFSDTLTFDLAISSDVLTDAAGYAYIFVSNVSNAEDRSIASYVSGSANGSSWTSAAVGSTTWS